MILIGPGVSAAAILAVPRSPGRSGVRKGTNCRFQWLLARQNARPCPIGKAPIDVVGTGSYLPDRWSETYATADIVQYDGKPMVKVGREFLLRDRH